jgi:RNA polymerase sigma-70 factor (ECF subfamily)
MQLVRRIDASLRRASRSSSSLINKLAQLWINRDVRAHTDIVEELEGLYRARYRHFLRVALLITRDEERAHDAVQEGFAASLRALRTYRSEGPLEAWVWRAVVNAAKKQQRHKIGIAPETVSAPSAENGGAEDERVRAWIASLPERQRLAVFLRYYADLDYRAIATVLDVAVGTVSATLNAAHQRLRSEMLEVPK